MSTTPAPTNPDVLTVAECASINRYYRSKSGPVRAVAMRYRSRPNHSFASLEMSPTADTAAWYTSEHRRDGTKYHLHHIKIGTNAPKHWTPRTKASPRRRAAALRDLLTHEAAHAAFTGTNTKGAAATCKRLRIPFRLLNIHEDARIESAWTVATGKLWTWPEHYPLTLPECPAALLLNMSLAKSTSVNYDMAKIALADAQWIADHYTRTADPTQTPNTKAAILRTVEFCRRFPKTALPPPPRGEGIPTADDGTPEGDTITEPTPDAEKELSDEAPVTAPDDGTGTPKRSDERNRDTSDGHEVVRRLGHGAMPYARPAGYPIANITNVPQLAQTLADLTKRLDRQPVRLATTGNRIHLPALVAGGDAPFRSTAPARGRAEITVIMDMSGSMSEVFTADGAAFLGAMLQLARQGAFTLHTWLSGGSYSWKMPSTATADDVSHLAASKGTESLARTMRASAADRQRSRMTFIYTDGQITDDSTPETHSAFGLLTCRNAAQIQHYSNCMREHFGRFRIAETATQLAREAVRLALS